MLTASNTARMDPRPLGRDGEGLSELGMASLPLPRHPYFFAKNFWKKRS